VSALDVKMLRQVKLTAFDIKTINGLVQRGGETGWFPRNKPEWLLVSVESMIGRGLVQVIERVPHGLFLRLTDLGRLAAEQIETMSVAPPSVDVQMRHETHEVPEPS
jgi:hypothetical protein